MTRYFILLKIGASSIKPANADISCIYKKERPPPRVQKHRYSLNELRRTLWPLPIMGERREKNSLHCAMCVGDRL